MNPTVPAKIRPGISLLEVLVALAIFMLSLIAIDQLVSLGADRARDVQQQAQALQLCQSKLAEVVAGVVSLQAPQSDTPFDEDPNWMWSLESEQGSVSGLWNVTVYVSRHRPDGSRVEVALSQMVLDPSIRGNPGSAASGASSGSDSSSSSGNTVATTQPQTGSGSSPSVPSSGKPKPSAGGRGGSGASPSVPSSGPSKGGK